MAGHSLRFILAEIASIDLTNSNVDCASLEFVD